MIEFKITWRCNQEEYLYNWVSNDEEFTIYASSLFDAAMKADKAIEEPLNGTIRCVERI